jgi:hypothetical protein
MKMLFILIYSLILFTPLLFPQVMSGLIKSLIMSILICQSSILAVLLLQKPDSHNN